MMSLKLKRLLGRPFRMVPLRLPRRVVLMYHSVGDGPNACPAELFADHMEWLARHAQILPLDTLLEGDSSERLQVAITFDDGYASVANVAAPIMARYGIAGTVYLTAACIGVDESNRKESDPALGHLHGEHFMTWSEAGSLRDAGWQIGSHGFDHVDLTLQGPKALENQLIASKDLIESTLGIRCDAFAYPWGRNTISTRRAVSAAGYRHAAGTIHGPLRSQVPKMAFARIDVRRDYKTSDLARILRGDWDYLGIIQFVRMARYARS